MDRPVMAEERHPLITSLPTGLWLASLGADVMYRTGRAPASWDEAAFFSMFAGLVAALLLLGPSVADELLAGGLRLRQPGRLEMQLAVGGPVRHEPVSPRVRAGLDRTGLALVRRRRAARGRCRGRRETARPRPFPREIRHRDAAGTSGAQRLIVPTDPIPEGGASVMRKYLNAIMLGSLLTIGVVHSFGCGSHDGPAEEAGEKVDDAVDKMKDKVD
jgi:hypothetical protein